MKDDKIIEKKMPVHISDESWRTFVDNSICPEDYLRILEHAGNCTRCAEKLSSIMENSMDIMPPAYLKDQIRERTRALPAQTLKAGKRISKEMQLFWYSLKVSGAVAVSLFVLFFSGPDQECQMTEAPWAEEGTTLGSLVDSMNRAAGDVANGMNIFANFILNGGMEND